MMWVKVPPPKKYISNAPDELRTRIFTKIHPTISHPTPFPTTNILVGSEETPCSANSLPRFLSPPYDSHNLCEIR